MKIPWYVSNLGWNTEGDDISNCLNVAGELSVKVTGGIHVWLEFLKSLHDRNKS